LLVIRELLLGPRRYKDFMESLDGITTNLLAQRLQDLEEAGIITHVGQAYELTPEGRELEPALLALGKWGWLFMEQPARGDRVNVAWGLISMKRRFRGTSRRLTVELLVDGRAFQFRLRPEAVELREGRPWDAEVSAEGSLNDFRELLFSGASSKALQKKGALRLSGDSALWPGFVAAFGLTE
jgi:DNA-binding HxlR family transcriptional regulator